jgi:hypothetical protein
VASKLRTTLELTCLGVAATAAPLLDRLYLYMQDEAAFSGHDMVGTLSDLGVSLIVAALLIRLVSRFRLVAMLSVVAWCLLNYASFEYIRELGTGLQFIFAGFAVDRTFVTGSLLTLTSPALLISTLALSMLACGWLVAQRTQLPGTRHCLVGGSALLVALSAFSIADEDISWRERHFAHQNLEQFLQSFPVVMDLELLGDGSGSTFSADLSGQPLIELPRPRTNVLLLVLEGIPAIMLEQNAQRRGFLNVQGAMPRLSERAANAIQATNFVLHQRQTNRGLYSLVCGRYPKLRVSTSRMTEYAHAGGPPCLPHVLGGASYRSVYIQAAPLSFMLKDAFAEQAGFDEIYGNQHFEDPIIRTNWGVDDRSLFRKTGRLIRKLEKKQQPWFITLLTAGTHHPFHTVPESARLGSGRSDFWNAARYLDASLFEFLRELEKSGTLNNTLVIITSDESRAVTLATEIPALLLQNWGPLVVLSPRRETMTLTEPYGQSDIAISILDYLGIDSSESGFIGRSLFRSYTETRRISFANVFQKHSGAIDSAGNVLWCDEQGSSCSKFAADLTMLFKPLGERQLVDAEELAELQYVIQRTLGEDEATRQEQIFTLTGDKKIPLLVAERQIIMDGQNLFVPERSRIEVAIELLLDGGDGEIVFVYKFVQKNHPPFYEVKIPPISAGDRVTLHFQYETLTSIRNLKSQIHARQTTTDGISVRFEIATLKITPIPEEETPKKSRFLVKPDLQVLASGDDIGLVESRSPPRPSKSARHKSKERRRQDGVKH